MDAPACPCLEELTGYLSGNLPRARHEALTEHIDGCAACQQRLEEAASAAQHTDLRRAAASSPFAQEPERERVVAQAKAMGADITIHLRERSAAARGLPHRDRDDELRAALAHAGMGLPQPGEQGAALGHLAHFKLLEILGQGGFGIVFRAFDEVLERAVALKMLAPRLAATDPERKRFLYEARAAAQVRHEHVVQIYTVQEQPLPYLVMELVPGESLQQRLDRTGRLEVAAVVTIGRQIAEGLAAAHAAGLIHRDIKPANILLEAGPRWWVKLTDFGLARVAHTARLTESGMVAGTPSYMSPEQARGDPLDHRSDLFSLGSVLYALTSGRAPFQADHPLVVLRRVMDDPPRPLAEIAPETPAWLCRLIDGLLAKNASARPQTAAAVAAALAGALAPVVKLETMVQARKPAGESAVDTRLVPVTPAQPAAPAPRRRWPARTWRSAAIVALVAVLAVAASVLTHSAPDPNVTLPELPAAIRPTATSPPKQHTNALGMKFRLIPAGKFTMGSPQAEIDRCCKLTTNAGLHALFKSEGPEHEVEITQPFYMGETEVTVSQYRQFAGADPARGHEPLRAAVHVSWLNAVAFCRWLSAKEGKKYRLPTEAEWEYACRAGRAGTRYCFGDDEAQLADHGWYSKNARGWPQLVAGRKPNAWGLYDMHGNVWELCQDNVHLDHDKRSPTTNPVGPSAGNERVMRGGSWFQSPVNCRSASRTYLAPNAASHDVGFRVVLEVFSPPDSAAAGPAIPLLPLVNVARDSIGADWQLVDGVLTSPGLPGPRQLQLPYCPPADYDLSLCAERKSGIDADHRPGGGRPASAGGARWLERRDERPEPDRWQGWEQERQPVRWRAAAGRVATAY